MSKPPQNSRLLVDSQHALRVYLDALLCETSFAKSVVEPPRTNIVELESVTDEPPVVADAERVPEPIVAGIVQPDWARLRFQCLSFQVAGISLASPLEKLNGIVELKAEITELPGYAPWVVGLFPNRGRNVLVIDIARIILPAGRQANVAPVHKRARYAILVGDGRYGLVADGLSRVLTLEPDKVRWRSEHSRRPWLAGTAVEAMCAILDVDNLCAQLAVGLCP